jgi:hypothetical protein
MEETDRALKKMLLSEKVIVLADTCHSEAIAAGIGDCRSLGDDASLMNRFLQGISRAQGGVALLTSAEANEVSLEDAKWGGGHGVFTYYLLEGMRGAADLDGDGIVTIGELFEYVRDNVKQATGHKQHPAIGTSAYDRRMPVAIVANAKVAPPLESTENLDITFELALTPEEMAVGTQERIWLEQCGISVKIPAGVSPGTRILVKGKGRLDQLTQQRGDLYVLVAQGGTDEASEPEGESVQNQEEEDAKANVLVEDLGDGLSLEMVAIPGGTFTMGSAKGEEGHDDDEGPEHSVRVASFWMGKFAVTQAQWAVVAKLPKVKRDLDSNPFFFKGKDLPVERVSWHDAIEFCDRLSKKMGRSYRLPSEAEWEYGCRAGTTSQSQIRPHPLLPFSQNGRRGEGLEVPLPFWERDLG